MVKTPEGFRRPLEPEQHIFHIPAMNEYKSRVVEWVKPEATVLSDVQVCALYTGSKRKVYESALRSLARQGLDKRDAKIKQFPKFEKQDLAKAPRIINPRTPRYNLMLGKYLKKLEKPVYGGINHAWGGRTGHTVVKGLNCYDAAEVMRAKWDLFEDPVAVGLDATKWDAHVSMDALKFEHSVYLSIFNHNQELAKLLKWQLINHGKAYCDDGMVEFIMEGTRASGDLNTSMGNCIIACANLYAWCAEVGVTAELCNNGDDCVIICERDDLTKFMTGIEAFFERLGFRMEIEEPVDNFENVEFCQTRPVFDGERWRLMRNPLACMRKDLMCLIPCKTPVMLRKWLGAVGECGLASASGLPVLQEWYSMIQRHGLASRQRFKDHLFKRNVLAQLGAGLEATTKPVTAAARASFAQATGVGPDMQLAYEELFRRATIEPTLHPTGAAPEFRRYVAPIIEQAPSIFDNINNHLN